MVVDPRNPERRRRNVRTGLILLSIAVVFFVSLIVNYVFYR
jgi:hypothetical protein